MYHQLSAFVLVCVLSQTNTLSATYQFDNNKTSVMVGLSRCRVEFDFNAGENNIILFFMTTVEAMTQAFFD